MPYRKTSRQRPIKRQTRRRWGTTTDRDRQNRRVDAKKKWLSSTHRQTQSDGTKQITRRKKKLRQLVPIYLTTPMKLLRRPEKPRLSIHRGWFCWVQAIDVLNREGADSSHKHAESSSRPYSTLSCPTMNDLASNASLTVHRRNQYRVFSFFWKDPTFALWVTSWYVWTLDNLGPTFPAVILYEPVHKVAIVCC